jgi:hypothetical protein
VVVAVENTKQARMVHRPVRPVEIGIMNDEHQRQRRQHHAPMVQLTQRDRARAATFAGPVDNAEPSPVGEKAI